MHRNRLLLDLLLTASICASTQAQTADAPKVVHASEFHSEAAAGGLSATMARLVHTNEARWVEYQIPAIPTFHLSSCSGWDDSSRAEPGCCDQIRLEDSDSHLNSSNRSNSPTAAIYVLLRLDHGEVEKIRVAPVGCTLDAGGVAFESLQGVSADESVEFLGRLAEHESAWATAGESQGRIIDDSLLALSVHATPKATETLAALAAPGNGLHLREKAAFWLGAERGHDGLLALRRIESSTTDAGLREKLAFDLSINSDPGATDDLLRMAKSDEDSGVRGQAIFWLAQKAGKKVVSALNHSIDDDPDIAVKKRAVFALTQLPKDESVPQLMHVADTNSSFTVREEAIFWLGQSKDPRALEYIEDILKR